MRRPALNATVCECLVMVLMHVECNMEGMITSNPDEAEHYRQLERGVLYLNELRRWYHWKQGGAA